MGSVNIGQQTITWKYGEDLIASEINKWLYKIIKKGIYDGGLVSIASGDTVNIAPMKVICETNLNQAIAIKTDGTVQLEISESTPYITCQFNWVNAVANYMDFTAKSKGSLLSTDVIIGKGIYIGGTLTDISYEETTYGVWYNGGLSPSLKDNNPELGNNDYVVPTQLAVKTYTQNYTQNILINELNYSRSDFHKVKSANNRTVLCIPKYLSVVINNNIYIRNENVLFEIDISTSTYWDNITVTDWTIASNRAGKDFYIYACVPSSGNTPDIVLSANSTYPDGYTASNSRKIGGFHCLCVSAGTNVYGYINEGKDAEYLENMFADGSTVANGDTYHWLTNFVQGDILPLSCWDLIHRPNENADVEGKVYDPKTNLWVDIYLPSWHSGTSKLLSINGGTIADGTSSPAFHWYRFSQVFTNQGQRLPRQDHFVSCSLGAPQGVPIQGSADPVTTTGHIATNGLRIISNIGCEDVTGVLWQWGSESGTNTTTAFTNAFDANDKNVGGQEYSKVTRPLFGGGWHLGAACGSRGSSWLDVGLSLGASLSGRGFAEPK